LGQRTAWRPQIGQSFELALRLIRAHAALANGISNAMLHVILNKRPLRVVNDAFHGLRSAGCRIEVLDLGDAAPAIGVGYDHAGVDCEGLAAHDLFLDAARDHGLEQLAQKIALAKPAVAVLGKRRMIRDIAVEPLPNTFPSWTTPPSERRRRRSRRRSRRPTRQPATPLRLIRPPFTPIPTTISST
jgi:hypothetical protein